jgi:hypothetical protein
MEKPMNRLLTLLFASSLAFGVSASAQAAEVNMQKITCGELIAMPAGTTLLVAGWMSGYFNAKANNTTIDLGVMLANGQTVSDYCAANPAIPVMKAIESMMPK